MLKEIYGGLNIGLAGMGAAAGAAAGAQMDGNYVAPMAVGGAALGAMAIPVGWRAAWGAAGVASNVGLAYLDGVTAAAPYVGKAALGAAKGAGAVGALGAVKAADAIVGFGSNLVRWDLPTESLGVEHGQTLLGKATKTGGVKLTGSITAAKAGWESGGNILSKTGKAARGALINGQTVFWGGAIAKGAIEGFQDMNRRRMGANDGMITRATPRMPSYASNGGASGDLVFALNANRRG